MEKLQGVFEMAGAACHELNQPLHFQRKLIGTLLAFSTIPKNKSLNKIIKKQTPEPLLPNHRKNNQILKLGPMDRLVGVFLIAVSASKATSMINP